MSELVRYRFSVDEYHLMGDAGLFDEDDRVELLDGEVVEMAPQPPRCGRELVHRLGDESARRARGRRRLLAPLASPDVPLAVGDLFTAIGG